MEDVSGVLVVSALTFGDAADVADAIRMTRPTAVNLRAVDDTVARRFVDFLAGAMAVSSGTLERFADRVYLARPDATSLTTDQRAALTEYFG